MGPSHQEISVEEEPLPLTSGEEEVVRFFVQVASSLGLPRSIGELYGVLFASEKALSFDHIVVKSGVSKGATSQGLKFLQKIGAARTVYVPRDRRTFFVAETSLRQLVGGALAETARPQLEGNLSHLNALCERVTGDGENPYLVQRVLSLRNWHRKLLQILPLLARLVGSGDPRFSGEGSDAGGPPD